VLLIAAILADLACYVYGKQMHNWWPLVIAIPAGPLVIWLHRRDLL
jgi:hypothetical protein